MSPPEAKTRPAWRYYHSLIALALCYLLSFGPVLYAGMLLFGTDVGRTRVVRGALGVVTVAYYPHLALMSLTDSYYAYGRWWVMLGGNAHVVPRPIMKQRMGF